MHESEGQLCRQLACQRSQVQFYLGNRDMLVPSQERKNVQYTYFNFVLDNNTQVLFLCGIVDECAGGKVGVLMLQLAIQCCNNRFN